MKKPCKRGTTFLAFVKTRRGKTKVFDFQERGTVENELNSADGQLDNGHGAV